MCRRRLVLATLVAGCSSAQARGAARPAAPRAGTAAPVDVGRGLTAGELAVARRVFGESIDYQAVRIVHGKYVGRQPDTTLMTPQGVIFAPAQTYQADYSHDAHRRSVFIHEMAHAWQHQCGVDLVNAAIDLYVAFEGDYNAAYAYELTPSRTLRDFNHEQQASIIADYARLATTPVTAGADPSREALLAELTRTLGDFVTAPSCAALR